MKKILFAILAVSMLFTACEKDDEVVVPEVFVDVDLLDGLSVSDYKGFSGLTVIRNEAGDLVFDVTYTTTNTDFNSVKLYYTLNKDFTDAEWTAAVEEDDEGTSTTLEENRVDIEIDVPAADSKYSFTIAAADVKVGDVIRCYFRGYTKDADGEKVKEYYSPVGNDTFDHDVFSGWTVLTVK